MEFNEIDIVVSKVRGKKIQETIDEIVDEKKITPDTEDIFIDENNIFEMIILRKKIKNLF